MSKRIKDKKKKKDKKELDKYNDKLELDELLLVKLSPKAINILKRISHHGIYGGTTEEVAARFVNDVLQRFVEVEDIKIKL